MCSLLRLAWLYHWAVPGTRMLVEALHGKMTLGLALAPLMGLKLS